MRQTNFTTATLCALALVTLTQGCQSTAGSLVGRPDAFATLTRPEDGIRELSREELLTLQSQPHAILPYGVTVIASSTKRQPTSADNVEPAKLVEAEPTVDPVKRTSPVHTPSIQLTSAPQVDGLPQWARDVLNHEPVDVIQANATVVRSKLVTTEVIEPELMLLDECDRE